MIKKIISTLLVLSMIISSSVVYAADGTNNLVNVALNKPISYDVTGGTHIDLNPKENFVDGNTSNLCELLWTPNVLYPAFIIDLEKEYSISEIKLYAVSGRSDGRDQLWIDYSTDKSSWVNVCTRDKNASELTDGFAETNLTEDVLTINDFGTVTARYVRFKTASYALMSELEVYAESDDSSGGNTGGTPDDNTGNIPDPTPDDNTGNTPDPIPDGNPANTPSVSSDITLGDTSDAIPDDLENIAVGKGIDYDVTGGKPCTYPKENLVDGDTANLSELHLAQNPDVPYPAFVVDLGREYSISEIRLYAVDNRSEGRNQIWIDYSADGENWYNVCATATDSEASGFNDLSKDVLIINNFGDPNAKYVRMKTYSYALMSELMVFVRHPYPIYVDTQYTTGVLTTEFTQEIAPASVTSESFKVYANGTLLAEDTDYTKTVEGKKIKVEIKNVNYHYDTKFKIELSNTIYSTAGEGYKLKTIPAIEVVAPQAIEITGFEISSPDADGKCFLTPTIKNNTLKDDEKAIVFVLLLDENNTVKYKDMKSYIINSGENKTPNFIIDTSVISGKGSIRAFLWEDLKEMKVRTEAKKLELN